ncbi:MAG: OFA family MFS transporter [Armatimonadetes bacterium]|nr:OFA family MFS transporter [Armatimonadota bacterium]
MRYLDKECTIAKPGYNRWLVPPAALAIHLSIGMAYGFSVFWLPLSQALGITAPAPNDWKLESLSITFTLFFVLLGSSAALFGSWLERNGPRKAGVVAAFCWGGGFFISALGVYYHQIILLWLGSGVIGGCGLGLGYISPVSTLIKWFPDKRGMATGMAIMGFGGGAMIGSPLADKLMKHYASATSVGVWETFVTMGCIYLVAMLCGAFAYRIPALGWKPHGWTEPAQDNSSAFITRGHVHVNNAHKAPQFWMLWAVLCLNVSAGIGVLAVASPMLQEVFGGKLIGIKAVLAALSEADKAKVASIGAGFAGLLSLFNIGGRIFWASLSDHIGRKRTYYIFFVVGVVLYVAAAFAAVNKNVTAFVGLFCVILTMYGGGFATIPAYLADLFGTQYVGAIHGRLLTAWSTAGILGPVLVTRIRQFQIDRGVPSESAYNVTLYILAGLLFLGFISNLLVRPVDKRHFMSEDELEEEWQLARKKKDESKAQEIAVKTVKPNRASWIQVSIGWLLVGVPLVWGILKTVEKASALFQ